MGSRLVGWTLCFAVPSVAITSTSRTAAQSRNGSATASPGYHVEKRHPKWMLITGGVALPVGYLVSAAIAGAYEACIPAGEGSCGVQEQDTTARPLFIPVAGPFIALANPEARRRGTPFLVTMGVAQAGGLILLVTGLLTYESKVVADKPAVGVSVLPLVQKDAAELEFIGRW
jgi:hypothetical protein